MSVPLVPILCMRLTLSRGGTAVPDEILSFDEHRRRRDENPSLVRCARCGRLILATASRCPECGVNFQGEAWEYTHPSEREPTTRSATWLVIAAMVVLGALLLLVLHLLYWALALDASTL